MADFETRGGHRVTGSRPRAAPNWRVLAMPLLHGASPDRKKSPALAGL
jgi:hypothetical protein